MRVFVLGCGNAFGSRLTTTSLLVISGDCVCLVDCPYKLHNVLADFSQSSGMAVTCDDITHVIITHNHWDHVAGLEMFLRMRMLAREPRQSKPIVVTTAAIYDDLWNHTLSGSLRYFMDGDGHLTILSDSDYMQRMVVEPGETYILGDMALQVRSNATHPGPTIGIRLRDREQCISYSGDGIYDPGLANRLFQNGSITQQERDDLLGFLWDSKLIFHDVGEDSEVVHTRLSTLMQLPPEVRGKLRLVNLADDLQTGNLRLAEQYREYTAEARLA